MSISVVIPSTGNAGSPMGGDEGILVQEVSPIRLVVISAETNAPVSQVDHFDINILTTDTITSSHTDQLIISGSGNNDTVSGQTEARAEFLRCWVASAVDNTNPAGGTNPNNCVGENNSTFSSITTHITALDLTNPIDLTATMGGVPASGSFSQKIVRLYFNIPQRNGVTSLDSQNIDLINLTGAADVPIYSGSSPTSAIDHNSGDFTVDISSLTLANLSTAQIRARYTAAVVATPETQINIDAMAIELTGSF